MEFHTGVLYRKLSREHEFPKNWRCDSHNLLKDVNEFPVLDQFGRNLYGLGIESRLGRDFQNPFRPLLGPTQSPVQWVPGLFPRKKFGGARRLPHTPI